MKMNGAGIAEVSEKGTVGKSVEVFGVCCSRISSFCSLWDFVFFSARVKIAVPVSTDLEDDVIFFIKDF